jgi:hypothetical protein
MCFSDLNRWECLLCTLEMFKSVIKELYMRQNWWSFQKSSLILLVGKGILFTLCNDLRHEPLNSQVFFIHGAHWNGIINITSYIILFGFFFFCISSSSSMKFWCEDNFYSNLAYLDCIIFLLLFFLIRRAILRTEF